MTPVEQKTWNKQVYFVIHQKDYSSKDKIKIYDKILEKIND